MLKVFALLFMLFNMEGCFEQEEIANEKSKDFISSNNNFTYSVTLNDTVVRVIAQIDNNFQVKSNGKGNYEVTGGFTGHILLDLQFQLDFSIIVTISNKSMIRNPDGTPNGIAEYLIKNVSDVLVGEYYFLPYRARSMLPLHPITAVRSTVFFRQPNSMEGKNIFSSQFTYDVWKAIILMWCLLVVTTLCLSYFGDENILTHEIIFWLFSTSVHQSYYNPKKTSLRILFIFEMFFAMLVIIFFSAGLVYKFSMQILPIQSLQDLIDYNFKAIIPEFYILAYFSDYNDNTNEGIKFGTNTIKPTKFYNSQDSIEKIVEGGFAYFTSEDTRIVARKNNKTTVDTGTVCSVITSIDVTKTYQKTGFYVQKKSPLRHTLNTRLLKIMETGLIARYWTLHKIGTLGECPRTLKTKSYSLLERQLTLQDLRGTYFILQGGALLAVLILSIEKWKKHF